MPALHNEQMTEDSTVTAAKNMVLGITPKGNTGCSICDMMGYIKCRCPGKKGDESGSGNDESDIDDSTNLAKKENQYSAPYGKFLKPGEIPTLTLKLENISNKKNLSEEEKAALEKLFSVVKKEFTKFIEELQKQGISTKDYSIAVVGNELKINIPNALQHDIFLKRLEKLMDNKLLPRPAQNEVNDTKYSTPSPFSKLTLTPYK